MLRDAQARRQLRRRSRAGCLGAMRGKMRRSGKAFPVAASSSELQNRGGDMVEWRGERGGNLRGEEWIQGVLGKARWYSKQRGTSGGDGSRAPVELEEEEGDRDLFVNLGKFRGCV